MNADQRIINNALVTKEKEKKKETKMKKNKSSAGFSVERAACVFRLYARARALVRPRTRSFGFRELDRSG